MPLDDCRLDITSRVCVLEEQIINQKEATVLALAAADKAILNANSTAEKAVAKVELAAEKSYLESQIKSLRQAFDQQMIYQKEAILAALAAADKAIMKSETATEKRFEGVNEFRAALTDQATSMLSRSEFNVQFDNLQQRLGNQTKRVEDMQLQFSTFAASTAGKQIGFGLIGSIVMGLIAAVSATIAAVTFLSHFTK